MRSSSLGIGNFDNQKVTSEVTSQKPYYTAYIFNRLRKLLKLPACMCICAISSFISYKLSLNEKKVTFLKFAIGDPLLRRFCEVTFEVTSPFSMLLATRYSVGFARLPQKVTSEVTFFMEVTP